MFWIRFFLALPNIKHLKDVNKLYTESCKFEVFFYTLKSEFENIASKRKCCIEITNLRVNVLVVTFRNMYLGSIVKNFIFNSKFKYKLPRHNENLKLESWKSVKRTRLSRVEKEKLNCKIYFSQALQSPTHMTQRYDFITNRYTWRSMWQFPVVFIVLKFLRVKQSISTGRYVTYFILGFNSCFISVILLYMYYISVSKGKNSTYFGTQNQGL